MSRLGRSFVVALLVAGVHLGLSIYALGGASASEKGMGLWQGASRVLGFPLVYLDRLNYGPHYELMPRMDVFSLLVVANSVLWGVVVALLIHWISRRRRESGAR
jgi:hypothetical protein